MNSKEELQVELRETQAKTSALLLYTDTEKFRVSPWAQQRYVMMRLNVLKSYEEALKLNIGEPWWDAGEGKGSSIRDRISAH